LGEAQVAALALEGYRFAAARSAFLWLLELNATEAEAKWVRI
jgi:hypothetical protein